MDGISAPFAHARWYDDVAAVALDRDAFGHLSGAATDRLLVLPFEECVWSTRGRAVLAGLEQPMLGDERIPGGDALVFVFQSGIDIDAPHAGARSHRHCDQCVRIVGPPACDRDRVGGRFLEAAGAGNAARIFAGWVAITTRDRN